MNDLDLSAHWMPFTANRQFKKNPRLLVKGEGVHYTDAEGRKIFDGLSGLWTCGAGHGRKEINEAVTSQLNTLDYSPGFQFGHPLSFELANKVVELTPSGLDKVFFTDSGSETIDTVLKMARGYWRNKGQPSKTKFIGRHKGYHGVNFGGLGVGGIGFNRKLFGQTVEADHIPHTVLEENKFSRGSLNNLLIRLVKIGILIGSAIIFSLLTISKLQLENKLFRYDEGKKLFLYGEKLKKNFRNLIKIIHIIFLERIINLESSLIIFDNLSKLAAGFD